MHHLFCPFHEKVMIYFKSSLLLLSCLPTAFPAAVRLARPHFWSAVLLSQQKIYFGLKVWCCRIVFVLTWLWVNKNKAHFLKIKFAKNEAIQQMLLIKIDIESNISTKEKKPEWLNWFLTLKLNVKNQIFVMFYQINLNPKGVLWDH